jgi:phosphatidyl-myo-inositol alpha-mannosyltransferase
LRIALFAPYDLARPGGIASHIRSQARALRALGHAVCVYGPASAPLADGAIAIGAATVVTLGGTSSGAGFDPRSVPRIARLMAAERFDVVHVHEPLMPLAPWAAVWYARAPVVATFHVHRERGHRYYPLARPLLAPIMSRIARRIAVSRAARRTVATHFPGEYEIVPNGIDIDRFRCPAPRPVLLVEGVRHVLFVGRLEPRKGVDQLIAAMATVQRRFAPVRLVIVGDGPERTALARLALSNDVDVQFLSGITDEELPALYQWSDVACSPAIGGESFGIVLIEALAAGTPVVATSIEGYEEAVGSSECVRLVRPGDPEALAAALGDVLDDDGRRRQNSPVAVRLARQYDWNVIAQRLQSIYEETPGSTPDRAR